MKVDRTAELQVQNLKQREQGADKVATARNQEAQATDKVDLATPVRVGQQVIYVSLSKSLSLNGKAFDPSASAKSSELDGKVEPTEDNPLGFDYKTVAKNVLGFVTGYIKLAQSQGKDDQELQDLMTQARKGIDKGFGSARDELKGAAWFQVPRVIVDAHREQARSYSSVPPAYSAISQSIRQSPWV